ncbi:porin family protein [Sinomicrobium weinanense]|uniref:PorT family protein n=1 Tax=Sinomicrobium weinanense TaxID=2842200 RepID=A0A926JQQ0_9FLAO|nr:porin family protein [Sinomicrobium weinanense]MBC9795552.1 PorT family protein [Sinomicrobium weinanense]MBU3124573.1 PorT family protein [Sinomicrobium weinanense]
MNKKLLWALVLALYSHSAFSQLNENPLLNLQNFDKQPLHWGYFLGINQYDFKFDYDRYNNREGLRDVQVAKNIGFNVGLIGDLRINEYMNLRLEPGLYYTQRDLYFPHSDLSGEDERLREVKSTYIHVPLLLKVSTKRIGNVKPYIVGGLSSSINLGSNKNSKEDNRQGTFRMEKQAYYYEVGFGIDFYLYYFKFSPSIRGVFAFNDELKPDDDPNSPWTGNINGMYSRAIFINLTFE